MKNSLSLYTLSAALIALPLSADTIVMNNGDTYEGTITTRTSDSLFVEIAAGGNIKQEKILATADIREIRKASKEKPEFEAISALIPTMDAMTEDDYTKQLNEMVEPFRRKYRSSVHFKEVSAIKVKLETEREMVRKGQVKYGNVWYTPEEQEINAIEIAARRELLKATELATDSNLVGALNILEQFDELFLSTEAAADAAKLKKEAIAVLKTQTMRDLKSREKIDRERKSMLKQLKGSKKETAMAQFDQETARGSALYEREKDDKSTTWFTHNPLSMKAMQDNLKMAEKATSAKPKRSNTLASDYHEAAIAIKEGRLKDADKLVKSIKRVKSAKSYHDALASRLEAAEKAVEMAKQEKEAADEAAELAAKQAAEAAKAAEEDAVEKDESKGKKKS